MKTFMLAIALALMIEGIAPALFPNRWQAYIRKLGNESIHTIRQIGMSILAVGVILFWFIY